jgi:hypothetical protein
LNGYHCGKFKYTVAITNYKKVQVIMSLQTDGKIADESNYYKAQKKFTVTIHYSNGSVDMILQNE